jgi:hypothetical protein
MYAYCRSRELSPLQFFIKNENIRAPRLYATRVIHHIITLTFTCHIWQPISVEERENLQHFITICNLYFEWHDDFKKQKEKPYSAI